MPALQNEFSPNRHFRFRCWWADGFARGAETVAARERDLPRRYGARALRDEIAQDDRAIRGRRREFSNAQRRKDAGHRLQHDLRDGARTSKIRVRFAAAERAWAGS